MKMQILSWLYLLMCTLAIAFIACHSIEEGLDPKPNARDDQQQTSTRGVEAVIHNKRGANGGSDLTKKPVNARNGASDLPTKTLGGIAFYVCVVVDCFFLLL